MLKAHSRSRGKWHYLLGHLEVVAGRARAFGSQFGADELCAWLGWWHDAGKAHPDWQAFTER